jgi:DNA invertase Pin-like site-specific DNA recombinase
MTALVGSARVSTMDQSFDAQLDILSAAGVDLGTVFTDTLSGSAEAEQPGLIAMTTTPGPDTL